MSETLRLGFVGAGFIARFHTIALQMVRDTQLVGVYSPRRGSELAAFAEERGVGECRAYSSVRELCSNCDVVAILTPNYTRIEIMDQIVEAVKDGAQLKGLICEKPLGRTVAEATRLVECAN